MLRFETPLKPETTSFTCEAIDQLGALGAYKDGKVLPIDWGDRVRDIGRLAGSLVAAHGGIKEDEDGFAEPFETFRQETDRYIEHLTDDWKHWIVIEEFKDGFYRGAAKELLVQAPPN